MGDRAAAEQLQSQRFERSRETLRRCPQPLQASTSIAQIHERMESSTRS